MQIRTDFPDMPFTWAELRARGVRRRSLDDAVRERRVVRLFVGVYLRADVEQTMLVRAQAAALVISSHSVLCDRTAAWLLGVDVLRYRELDIAPPLESYVLRGHDPTDRPECDGGTRDLMPCDWTLIGDVRVTTPLRTAMDLGCKLSRRDALAAMDALARVYGLTRGQMRQLLPRYFRRRGVVQLRELVELVDGRAESTGETWARLEIRDHDLPAPKPQHWIMIDGIPTYRLDLAYPHARVVVEYDGKEFHSSPAAKKHDRERRKWLRDNGWKVIVLNKDSFTEEAISAWIGELRGYLGLAVA